MITLYTSNCPRCEVLKKKLDETGMTYEIFDDVDKMIKMGFTTVPILDVDGKRMNFKEAMKWINKGKD